MYFLKSFVPVSFHSALLTVELSITCVGETYSLSLNGAQPWKRTPASLWHTHTLIQCEHRLPFLHPPLWVLSDGGSKLEKGWKCFTYSRLRYTPTKSVECSLEENAKSWSSFHLFLKSPPLECCYRGTDIWRGKRSRKNEEKAEQEVNEINFAEMWRRSGT